MTVPCRGGHTHLRIEGKYTRPSAVYVPALAKHFALAFKKALAYQKEEEAAKEIKVAGLESVVVNDVLAAGEWKLEHQWHRKAASHINVLESLSYVSLLKKLAAHHHPALRFNALLDSRVAKGAHAKGRSTLRALSSGLHQAPAISVGARIYLSFWICSYAAEHSRRPYS